MTESDAAAFFAKKKKGKKKAFKFNANNIDATSVANTQHVDAPALSSEQEKGLAGLSLNASSGQADTPGVSVDKTSGEQWDDEALAATLNRKNYVAPGGAATTELLDMKSLGPKRNEQENIVERLRVEENKARLAAAKEGMEREAQRIKEEQEKKKEAESGASGPARFGAAAAAAGGSKWVPPHMRAGGAGLSRVKMGAMPGGKVDTQDENLFPDLAAADAIIEQQQKQQPAFKMVKKTPVGGGATWGARPAAKKAEPVKETQLAPAPAPVPASPPKVEASTTAAESAPAAAAPAPAATKPLVKKKKKKDLSTFKPS